MSLKIILVKYPTCSRVMAGIAIPLAIAIFWIMLTPMALGSDGTTPTQGEFLSAPLPIVGTSLTAGGAFWLLVSFLQKTIEKMENREREIRLDYEGREKRKDEVYNALRIAYDIIIKDAIDDARKERLTQREWEQKFKNT